VCWYEGGEEEVSSRSKSSNLTTLSVEGRLGEPLNCVCVGGGGSTSQPEKLLIFEVKWPHLTADSRKFWGGPNGFKVAGLQSVRPYLIHNTQNSVGVSHHDASVT